MTRKVGIISANWGAFAHLPAWRSLPGVEVTGICTSRRETAEAAAAKFGIARPFWSAEEMANDPDIDIIDCGTRPSLRHKMVIDCFKGGKHVYNGIPCAANIDDARDMHAAWKASGKVGVVDALTQWVPALRLMKEMVDQGYAGDLFGGTLHFNMCLFNPLIPQFPYNWFAQGGLGVSAVRNLGSHALHVLLHMFGPVAALVADDRQLLPVWTAASGETIASQTNDFANVTLRFVSGLTLQMQISWNAALGEGWLLDIFGSKGRIVSTAPSFPTPQDTKLRAGQLGGALEDVAIPDRLKSTEGVGIDWTAPVAPSYPMALIMRSMLDAIDGKGRAAPDFEQAWDVERVQEAIRLSSLERRWVQLEDVG
ncbi:MAG TPA: Gfo/Idh/MocA family oxidoreductase [Sphingobium sp.]|uniref:Gfo/Idh/MocA family protein n=1 Tax=Sphingobium sp. TaxID=1912891 RepID=UPI002ED4DE0D